MSKFRLFLYFTAGLPLFLLIVWNFAIPEKTLHDRILQEFDKAGSNITVSMEGFRKGLFLTLHAESATLVVDGNPALQITDVSGSPAASHLIKGVPAFSVKGKMGSGEINGIIRLPGNGRIDINRGDISSIQYLDHLGVKVNGFITSEINILNDNISIIIDVPDLKIDDSAAIPLLSTFHSLQGILSLTGQNLNVDSLSMTGEKGYARIKGSIRKGVMDLALELMPESGKLNSIESMLLNQYAVSPGYYVIPIKGPV